MDYSKGKIIAIADSTHEVIAYDCTTLDLSDYVQTFKSMQLNQIMTEIALKSLTTHTAFVVMECACTSEDELQTQLKQFKLQAYAMKCYHPRLKLFQ